MTSILTFILVCSLPVFVFSQTKTSPIILNQVLFSESEQSWTSRDLKLFEEVMTQILQKKYISPWSAGRNEDFLLSRLGRREAAMFDVKPAKIKPSEADLKKIPNFSASEIEDELDRLSQVLMFVDLKEAQLKQPDRFATWFNHLKRKYQVRIKSAEAEVLPPKVLKK